ncbi:alanine racemase [Rhodococcus opacus]|uniref:Alanine racemase n=1 Tax=Rhodococcus opacus TaxID=37919 RepID=A0A2S8J6T0_RHOOP|nr:alanine racemase [Rhodococcus opacus]PQP22781.1 alanine racemase [Rhodococcus opacus]
MSAFHSGADFVPNAAPLEGRRPAIEACVDLDAVSRNTKALTARAGTASLMAVVEANAYGHGAVPVAVTALAAGARELGVRTIAEGCALRRAGIGAPILAFAPVRGYGEDCLDAGIRTGIAVTVESADQVAAVRAAARCGTTATVQVAVDCGRAPQRVPHWADLIRSLRAAQSEGTVHVRGIYSSTGDDTNADSVVDRDRDHFLEYMRFARAAGVTFESAHLAGAQALRRSDLRFDMVRADLGLYGVAPTGSALGAELVPALTLSAEVALVKKIAAGDGVSYGFRWVAERDCSIALLPVGYADGIPRALGGRMSVLLGGRWRPQVGRVCMDQILVYLGTNNDVAEGDRAVLFGGTAGGTAGAQEWAHALGTTPDEILGGLRGRIEWRYVGGAPGIPGA